MANPFTVQPLGGLQNIQMIGQGMQGIAQNVQAERQQEQLAQAQQAVSEAFQSGDVNAIRQAMIQYPEMAEQARNAFGFTNEQTERVAREAYRRALSDPENAAGYMQQGIQQVTEFGGRPTMMTQDLQMLQENPEAALQNIRAGYAALASDPEFEAMFPEAGAGQPAGVRQFQSMVDSAGLEPGTEEYQRAALVSLGLAPRAGISAKERIAQNPELAQRVADLEAQTTAASERGKLETQREILPEIRSSIKEAEQRAESQGEALSELGRAQAAMPGLREVVNKLKTLSDVATYTMGGKVFDTVVKELGFGATEGATARAKMESLVNNQILPLLRDTFGAQFTEREGEQLRRTMLDIDAAPEQKKQILDSFIEQKMRDLEMKRNRAGVEGAGGQAGGDAPMSDEEADAFINQMLGQ